MTIWFISPKNAEASAIWQQITGALFMERLTAGDPGGQMSVMPVLAQ